MIKVIQKLISFYLKPLRIFKANHIDGIMKLVCREFQDYNHYVSYRIRPQKPILQIPFIKELCKQSIKTALLLQGPIYNRYNFTLETIKYYKKMYPDYVIIVSTWKNENPEDIYKIKREGVVVVQSDPPQKSGILNVNYQIISTRAGIIKAEELGVEYIIKSRTDQRIYKPYVLYSLYNLLKIYGVEPEVNMTDRIVLLSTQMHNMFTPYFLCDFFYYGNISDIKNLFSCQLDERDSYKLQNVSRKVYSKTMYPPEIYIMKNYLMKYLGQRCTDTVKEYWECLKKYFICIERDEIGLFSMKYDYSMMDHINASEYSMDDNENKKTMLGFSFWLWMNLYMGNITYKEEYEKELEVKF